MQQRGKVKRQERLEARVTVTQKKMIERAALMRGTTVTDFIVFATQKTAAETINDYETIQLKDVDRDLFLRSLTNPPEPVAKAKSAALKYKRES